MEGVAKAKEAGVYRGRKPSIDPLAIRVALNGGEKPAALARRLGIARSSVYRVAGEAPPVIECQGTSKCEACHMGNQRVRAGTLRAAYT